MAPANGTRTNAPNGRRAPIQPAIPALPLIPKSKKAGHPAQNPQALNKESPQLLSTTSENSTETGDIVSQKSTSKIGGDLSGQVEFSTPSVSALDETVSVQSSQEDPSPAVEHDSSITSIITSESVEPAISASFKPGIIPNDTAKQFRATNTPEYHGKPSTSGFRSDTTTRQPQENGFPEAARVTPDHAPLMIDISPLTHLSNDKAAVELSAYATPISTAPVHPEVSPEAIQPYSHHPSHFHTRSYPEVAQNGYQPMSHRVNMSNGHHSTASLPKPLPTILEHLLFLANSKQLADWAIRVDQPGLDIQAFVTYAHSFVLSRSERIRKVMAQPPEQSLTMPLIRISPARSIQPHAFEAALRFFYSDTVLSMEALLPPDTYMDRHARAHVVDYILSYWIAGIELGLDPVCSRAHSLLAGMVDWDIAELLVREALSLRSLPPTRPDYQVSTEPRVMGASILRLVLGLFLHRFDAHHFKLDTVSHPTMMSSRFAQLDQARTPANPVLAGMVFGSMPTSGTPSTNSSVDEKTWSADTVASLILLNLDFSDLNDLSRDFIRVHGSIGAQIMAELIQEREKRRLRIFHNTLVSNKERTANPACWEIVGWQESFGEGHLHRERLGFVLPNKKTRNGQFET